MIFLNVFEYDKINLTVAKSPLNRPYIGWLFYSAFSAWDRLLVKFC